MLGTLPAFEATEALSVAWSDATLEYLHDLSCEDPLTGLASLAHVRTRLDEIYREAELTDVGVAGSHALVVVELCSASRPGCPVTTSRERCAWCRSPRRCARSTRAARRSVGSAWTGPSRSCPRNVDLGMSVALLREFLDDLELEDLDVRVWIEGLPASPDSATRLLDDLAR